MDEKTGEKNDSFEEIKSQVNTLLGVLKGWR